jgi:hypothetical protein
VSALRLHAEGAKQFVDPCLTGLGHGLNRHEQTGSRRSGCGVAAPDGPLALTLGAAPLVEVPLCPFVTLTAVAWRPLAAVPVTVIV